MTRQRGLSRTIRVNADAVTLRALAKLTPSERGRLLRRALADHKPAARTAALGEQIADDFAVALSVALAAAVVRRFAVPPLAAEKPEDGASLTD